MTEHQQCEFTKPDGERCRGRARPSGLCTFHDPATEGKRREGRSKGGKTACRKLAVLAADAPDFPLGTPGDIRAMLGSVTNLMLKGALDVRLANAAGYLGAAILRSIEGDEVIRRIEALEVAERRRVK